MGRVMGVLRRVGRVRAVQRRERDRCGDSTRGA